MGIFSTIGGWLVGGGTSAIASSVEKGVEIFRPNAEKSAVRGHEADMASLAQFASEFGARSNRSYWDSFVDGLNRLPRPLITLGVLSFFILAPADPERFIAIASAYQLMPPGFWGLLSIIIAFYFGGRLQVTGHRFAVSKHQIALAKEISTMRREADAAYAAVEPDDESFEPSGENKVVKAWLAKAA